MAEFLIANMAPIIFISMVIFLLVGFPVAFALAANGVVFGLLGIELGLFEPSVFQAMPDRISGVMSNDTMLAVPFFTSSISCQMLNITSTKLSNSARLSLSVGSIISVPCTGNERVGAWYP